MLKVTESDTLVDPDQTGTSYHIGARQVSERPTGLPGRDMIDLVVSGPAGQVELGTFASLQERKYLRRGAPKEALAHTGPLRAPTDV